MARKRSHAVRAAISPIGDDLTLVKGIGPIIAARLHDIGILKFAHLAKSSPEDLAAQISGLSTRRIANENWIKQARRLAQRAGYSGIAASKASNRIRQRYATFTVELLLGSDNSVRRTRVTYVQNKTEETWAGWEESKLTAFLRKCAGLNEPVAQPPHPPALALPSEETQKSIVTKPIPYVKPKGNISGPLQVSDLVTLPLESDVPQSVARASERFKVRFVLDLTQVKAASISFQYTATIWAKKMGTRIREIVGEAQGTCLPAAKVPCLVEAMIPNQGTYRLEAVITLTPASTIPSARSTLKAWIESRLFQVC